jgi:hypothetical protein
MPAVQPSPAVARFLACLPDDLAASFSEEQLAAIELHFAMRYRMDHVINWRFRFGLGGLRSYIVVLAGRDRRRARA